MGPAALAVGATLAAAGVVIALVLGWQDRALVALFWAIIAGALGFSLLAFERGGPKRRAAAVARLTGTSAFVARVEPLGSARTDPLRGARASGSQGALGAPGPVTAADFEDESAATHPIVCSREGMLEFWRSADDGAPFAVVPLGLVTADVDPRRGPFRAAVLRLRLDGLQRPLAFSFYRSGWVAVLPADALDLEEIASELGIRVLDGEDRSVE